MKSIVKKAEKHCITLLKNSHCTTLPFHGITHTLQVHANVQTIGAFEKLDSSVLELVQIAALFHDTGLSQQYVGHEEASIHNAITFLKNENYPIAKIDDIVGCIYATKMPQNPQNILEAILCDADLFHLSSTKYMDLNELLRREWSVYNQMNFTDEEWVTLNVDFFKHHEFHTLYGSQILAPKKAINFEALRQLQNSTLR